MATERTTGVEASGGSAVVVRFASEGAAIDARPTVVDVTEHLIVLEMPADARGHVALPTLGAMVELEIGRRTYRSTVQHTVAGGFTVLRPRELDDLTGRLDLALLDEI